MLSLFANQENRGKRKPVKTHFVVSERLVSHPLRILFVYSMLFIPLIDLTIYVLLLLSR